MNYYILTTADAHKARLTLPSARQVALGRLQRQLWGFNAGTRNRAQIGTGDAVLVYLSGSRELGKHFIARAHITEKIEHPTKSEQHMVDNRAVFSAELPSVVLRLTGVHILNPPVSIVELKRSLTFIRDPNSKKWGAFLQGGCLKISQDDFELVLAASKSTQLDTKAVKNHA